MRPFIVLISTDILLIVLAIAVTFGLSNPIRGLWVDADSVELIVVFWMIYFLLLMFRTQLHRKMHTLLVKAEDTRSLGSIGTDIDDVRIMLRYGYGVKLCSPFAPLVIPILGVLLGVRFDFWLGLFLAGNVSGAIAIALHVWTFSIQVNGSIIIADTLFGKRRLNLEEPIEIQERRNWMHSFVLSRPGGSLIRVNEIMDGFDELLKKLRYLERQGAISITAAKT